MDNFKIKQLKEIGHGGFKCPCCNTFKGKNKRILNKIVRSNLKLDLKKELYNIEGER